MMSQFFKSLIILYAVLLLQEKSQATIPVPSHVVVLVLENHGYNQVFGSSAAPYLNSLINDPYSALFTQSFGLSHPSQPNYLQLFSGSTQGIADNNDPLTFPFTTVNLGGSLLNNAHTFTGYSEDLPSAGFNGTTYGQYARKHNPWVNWQGSPLNGIPATSNQPFTAFPTDYNLLPDVSFVVPNQDNDMHNGTDPSRITTCDLWVQQNLNGYIQWAKTHNSLLIITFDEDDNASAQHIFTLFIGHMVQHGSYNNVINHYNILRMMEDMYSLPHSGSEGAASTIDYCWNTCYLSIPTVSPAGPVTLCTGGSITLSSSSAVSYLWSTGATTSTINITSPGTYSVTTTAANSCVSTSQPVIVVAQVIQSYSTLFTESMGSVGSNTAITTHESNNGFDNDAFTMSGSGEIRNTNVSSGYDASAPAASGLGNAFLTNTIGKNFIISGINTSGLSNLQLSFGVYKSTTTGAGSNGSDLSLTLSSDGINYNTTLTIPVLPTGTGTNKWYYVTASGNIPSVPNLSLQFKENGTTTQYRIDDLRLQYATGPVITASGSTSFCPGDSVLLTASNGNTYLWSNGATTRSILVKNAGNYSVSVDCISSPPITVTLVSCNSGINLKVFLGGFYTGNRNMMPVINPANYPARCDVISVSLYDTTASHLLSGFDTDTLSTSGSAQFWFPDSLRGKFYYVSIRHRNSIETWLKHPESLSATVLNIDLTIPDTTAANNPAPVLSSISPSSAIAGASTFTMTLTGSNFVNSSVAKWNGSSLATTYVNSTQLTASIPAVNVLNAGTASVTVFNPAPGGGTSAIKTFTINNPVPILSVIAPSSVTAGSATFIMTLTGSNFVNGSIAQWNGSSLATTFISSAQLTASIPAVNILNSGTANITVFNPTPAGGTSGVKTFTINPATVAVKKFLFDATKAETAGNADWVIDEDNSIPGRLPTPAQSNITSGTTEGYWTGAISSWGIALVKNGNYVETLPSGTAITYGNSSNPQDLSNYDVYVVDEPNILFTASEKTAILSFVNNGGGLFMVADHNGSDRNGDTADSPKIWNDLMINNSIINNPFGLSIDLTNFSDLSSNILSTWNTNPIMNGTQGAVSQLEFNAGASITINTAANPNVKGLIWKSSVTKNNTNIMCASSTYGTGRVFLVTDSSPIDDGTGTSGNTLYVGWPLYSHTQLFMNASLWLAKLQ